MFPKEKTKWLAILHAGWPGGMVLAGLMLMAMGDADWSYKVALIFIPTAIYGLMMFRRHFPKQERVTAGASYRDMCQEAGVFGMFIAVFLIVAELMRIGSQMWPTLAGGEQTLYQLWNMAGNTLMIHGLNIAITIALLIPFAIYVRGAIGNWLFIVILLLMLPLASTELSTDAWMPDLMEATMQKLFGVAGGWVLIYSASVMMVLRFFAGPLVKPLGPVGLLAVSAGAAGLGLALLSIVDSAALIFLVITIYAIGQTFFWPCMLGVVSERLPRGGALTINTVGGVGMLGAGLLGAVLIGNVIDHQVEAGLRTDHPQLHAQVVSDQQSVSLFGPYTPIAADKVKTLDKADAQTVKTTQDESKKAALLKVAVVPSTVCIGFIILLIVFKMRGGYKPVDIADGEIRME